MKRTSLSMCLLAALSVAAGQKEATRPGDAPARLALLSDLHLRQATNEEQVLHHQRFHQAIAQVNAARVDLVLLAGDLTEFGRAEELARLKEHLRQFQAPVWCVPGNHDVGNKRFNHLVKPDGITARRVRHYEGWLGPGSFARTHAGVRVIGLNSVLLGSGLQLERQVWALLERELATPAALPTILLTHFPLFEKTVDEPSHEYWNLEAAARARLLRLLRQGGVKAVLSGHLHRQLEHRLDGILFFTTAPVSFGIPKGQQPEGWTLITVPAQGQVQTEFRPLRAGPGS